ncbi:MAG: hypothetical protein IPP17_30630 [Bacteroidetes bacterium]|nr:hypothetical protein [Bacteroidota bacterium]
MKKSRTLLTDVAVYFGQYITLDQHSVAFEFDKLQKLVFGNDGGVWYSSNCTNCFRARQITPLPVLFLRNRPRAGRNRIIGGAQDNGSTMVDAPGISAGIELTGSDGGYVAINAIYPDTMFTTTQYATVRRSRNGGNTFQSITNPSLNENKKSLSIRWKSARLIRIICFRDRPYCGCIHPALREVQRGGVKLPRPWVKNGDRHG